MGVVIVFIVLVVGFLYTYNHPPSRFRQYRATGWNSYFHIAAWGVLFSTAGAFCTLTLMWLLNGLSWFADFFPFIIGSNFRFPLLGNAIFTHGLPAHLSIGTISSLILGAAMAYGQAKSKGDEFKRDGEALMKEYGQLSQSDGMEHLLFQSMKDGLLVLMTLKSRKVYVGIVQQPRFLHGDLENVVIIPMLSGYRNKDNLSFQISHSYRDYYDKHDIHEAEGRLTLSHFRTVIPISEIESASLFDLHTYTQFQQDENQPADS